MRLFVGDIPELSTRWACDLNDGVDKSSVPAGTRKRYWWRCQTEPAHVWKSSPHDLPKRCPICHPRHPVFAQSLAGLYPKIADEIDRTLPSQPKAEDLFPQSNKKLTWRCRHGHSYQATVQQRTKHERQCPECLVLGLVFPSKSGRRLSTCYNLLTEFPDIASELHPSLNGNVDASRVSPKTSKKFFWQCTRNPNHVWQTSVSNRTRLGSGCPYCYNQTSRGEIRVYAEIRSVFANVEHRRRVNGREIDVWLETMQIGIEYDGAFWHKDTEDQDNKKIGVFERNGISLIRIREQPLAADRGLDLSIRHPISKADMNNVFQLICKVATLTSLQLDLVKDYISKSTFSDEAGYNRLLLGCDKPPFERSLASNPSVANTWHAELNSPLMPSDVWIGSNAYAWFACATCTKAFRAKVYKRASLVQNVAKCKQCASALRGDLLLKDANPALFSELAVELNNNVDIATLRPNSNKVLWWRCPNVSSHLWKATVAHRTSGTGCPYCVGRSVDALNSLMTVNPMLAARWDYNRNEGLMPDEVTASSAKKVWWRCDRDERHRFEARIYNMARRPNACPFCSGKLVNDSNSLQALQPQIARQWHPTLNSPLSPANVTCQSGKKIWWQCPEDPLHVWQATVQRRVIRGSGCPECRMGSSKVQSRIC